jgi:FkbM family methyltransferase
MMSLPLTAQRWLRAIPPRWHLRGQTRISVLLERLLQRGPETIGLIGAIRFPFLSGPRHRHYFFDMYEREVVAVLRGWLRPGDVFVDVGANDGYFSAIAADCVGREGKVYCAEPAPQHYRRLQRLIELNPQANIVSHPVALFEYDGTMELHLSPHDGWHTLVPGYAADARAYDGRVPVGVRSLDRYLDDNGLLRPGAVRLLKVDVEGSEARVVRGAAQTIAGRVAAAVLIEVVPACENYHVPPTEELFDRFLAAGYRASAFDKAKRVWGPVAAADLLRRGLTNVMRQLP